MPVATQNSHVANDSSSSSSKHSVQKCKRRFPCRLQLELLEGRLAPATINGKTSADGGGVHNDTGTVNVLNSVITNNTSDFGDGGGIFMSAGAVNITGSTISANVGGKFAGGGGIENGTFSSSGGGTLTITN